MCVLLVVLSHTLVFFKMMFRAVTKTTVNMRNLREETRPNNMVKVLRVFQAVVVI